MSKDNNKDNNPVNFNTIISEKLDKSYGILFQNKEKIRHQQKGYFENNN